jgi:hypothetical protein
VTTDIPPLAAGQRLTRAEFERRYDALPGLKKAELLEGVVYMPSPVRLDHHGTPHAALIGWLMVYWAGTPGVRAAVDTTIRLPGDNEPQPDGLLYIEPARGGRITHSADDYVEGGPELVCEVAASSADTDLGVKRDIYQRHGVREYLVWRVDDGALDWHVLCNAQFQLLAADAAGVLRSEAFPGLWLDGAALVRLDLAAVLGVLQQGLAAPAHAAFVARLAQAPPQP